MPSFWHHLLEASLPVLKICLLGAVGAGLSSAGILDQQGRRTLSKLIYCLFTPALTFTKLAPVLTGQHLILWMPLAINMFVSVAAGLLLGLVLLVVVRPPAGLKRHVLVATGLGNAGNLPLVLVAALIRETGGKLFEGEVLSEDLAIAYVAMGIWAATITHFTIGTELLKLTPAQQQQQQQQQDAEGPEPDSSANHTCTSAAAVNKLKHSSSGRASHAVPVYSSSEEGAAASCVVELGRVTPQGGPAAHQQHQHSGMDAHDSAFAVPGDSSSNVGPSIHSNHSSSDCLVLATPAAHSSSGKGGCCASCGSDRPRYGLDSGSAAWQCQICGATNHAATAAAVVVHQEADGIHRQGQQQRQLQHWADGLHDAAGQERTHLLAAGAGPHSSSGIWLQGGQHHSRDSSSSSGNGSGGGSSRRSWVRRAAGCAGDVLSQLSSPPMVGCMLAVVVGLIRPLRDQLFAPGGKLLMLQDCISMFGDCCIPCLLLMLGATLSKGPGSACPPLRVVAGVAAARLVVLPLLGTGWLVLAKSTGLFWAPDKMFILVMLIQNAVPTALNVHTLATLHNNKEAEMGAMLFWQYLAACVTLPAALSFFLWLLNTPVMSSAV